MTLAVYVAVAGILSYRFLSINRVGLFGVVAIVTGAIALVLATLFAFDAALRNSARRTRGKKKNFKLNR